MPNATFSSQEVAARNQARRAAYDKCRAAITEARAKYTSEVARCKQELELAIDAAQKAYYAELPTVEG